MSPFVKAVSLSVALLFALPAANAFAAEPVSGTDAVTCVPIPRVDYQGQTIYPGGKVCVPTP